MLRFPLHRSGAASAHHPALQPSRATGQPIVQSLTAGESWRWYYLDETIV